MKGEWAGLILAGAALGAAGVFLLARLLLERLGPVLGTQLRAREERHRERLENLFLSSENARLFAWLEVLAPVAVCGFLFAVSPGSPVLVVTATAGTVIANRAIYAILERRRRQRLENDLPEALQALANGARAGLNLEQALRLVEREFGGPVSEEIGLVVRDVGLGSGVIGALERARRRVRLDTFSLMVTALSVAHERGGNLVEILDEISRAVREVHRLERKVKSETANVRLSAKIMAASPVVFLIMFNFIDPDWNRVLFRTVLGNLVLAAVAVLVVISYLMVVRLGNPDI